MKLPHLAMTGLLALAGCFSVESAKAPPVMGEDAVEHVIVYNYGWNLFGCLPVVCGNGNFDSWCPFAFFRNEVRQDLAQAKLVDYADERNCDLRDLMVFDDRDVFFDFYYAPIPWVIQYKEINLSATLVKKAGEARR